MQVPTRRNEGKHLPKLDPYLTEDKFNELKDKLARLLARRPSLAIEVKRLAEMGDFSENAGYQLAKGRLRGLNQRILNLEYQLKNAEIIPVSPHSDKVQIGSSVVLESAGQEKTYRILGSTETDPSRGIISHTSPLGAALLNHHAGEIIKIVLGDKEKSFKILKIS
ncbi:MAG: GreA/GreB family elongation factor [Patescibacteria group bacterium]|jgi:transcription elongation factor GreA